MAYEKRVHDAMRAIHAAGLAESAHDVSDGGLAVAVAECCTAEVGAHLKLKSDLEPALLLFHEAPSRIVVSTKEAARVQEICAKHDIEVAHVGETAEAILEIESGNGKLVHLALAQLAVPGIERYLQ